jgi:hypothetical protein
MKNIKTSILGLAILTMLIFISSCTYDDCKDTIKYQEYSPVYLTATQLRQTDIGEPQELKNPGKIYVYGSYLFVNELYEGVHIFDNSNPESPVNLAFLRIPGNVDIAVKSNILYADNFIDLLSFDITEPANPRFIDRQENVFSTNKYEDPDRGYLVFYRATDVIREFDCSETGGEWFFFRGEIAWVDASSDKSYSGSNSSVSGIGGSMARFTILGDRLYTVDQNSLKVFNIDQPASPFFVNDLHVGWGIETIYPFKGNLFIGSNAGMFIYNTTDPDQPTYMSEFRHAVACDPVFVVGDIAYVTLRTGNRCFGTDDQLDVIDIKDLYKPKLIKTYRMDNPHGLSVINDKMILCEGQFGLKVLDVEDPLKIKTKEKISGKHFYDVIILSENNAIVVGDDGLYQYKFNGYKLKQLSSIKIVKK